MGKVFIKSISACLFLVSALSFATAAMALSIEPVPLKPVDCFADGLYKFQSVDVSVGPMKSTYQPGETVVFTGEIVNSNNYPVVDGNVFVRIGKINDDTTEWHDIVAEVVALENISIDASSTLPVTFSWVVPATLGAGDYQVDHFFSVGKKFNLGGLPFSNEIIVGYSTFKVTGSNVTQFAFNRTGTKVNNEKYNHIGNWPFIHKDEKIEFTQPLQNFSNKDLTFEVSYDLYFWDSLNPADKLNSKKETVIVPANSSKNLSYTIPKSERSTYYLQITATVNNTSSLVNIRTTSDIVKSRLNYPAITTFPLLNGKEATLFSCYHTIYGEAGGSKLVLTLTDKDNQIVANGEYVDAIKARVAKDEWQSGSEMSAAAMKFISSQDYTFLKLKAELYNTQGGLEDSYETEYDCSTLRSDKCEAFLAQALRLKIIIYSIILIIIALLGLFISKRATKNLNWQRALVTIFTAILVITVVALIYTLFVGINRVTAATEVVSSNGQIKTGTSATAHTYRSGCWWEGSCRDIVRATITRTSQVTSSGGDILDVGQTRSFTVSNSCSFSGSGSNWDTPLCGWVDNPAYRYTYDAGYGNKSRLMLRAPASVTSYAVSSNRSVVSCNGLVCTATNPGTANVKVVVPATTIRGEVGFTTDDGEHLRVTVGDNDGTFQPRDLCDGGSCSAGMQGNDTGEFDDNGNTLMTTLPAYTTSNWMVTVAEPLPGLPVIDFSANPASVAYNGSTTLNWNVTEGVAADTSFLATLFSPFVVEAASQIRCFAFVDWADEKSVPTGSEIKYNLTTNKHYQLQCSNSTGITTGNVYVTVGAAPGGGDPGATGGGGYQCGSAGAEFSPPAPQASTLCVSGVTATGLQSNSDGAWDWVCGADTCGTMVLTNPSNANCVSPADSYIVTSKPSGSELCDPGFVASNPEQQIDGSWSWTCSDTTDFASVCASLPPVVNDGACLEGTITFPSTPNPSNMCLSGTPTVYTGTGTAADPWMWNCDSTGTGEDAIGCSATKEAGEMLDCEVYMDPDFRNSNNQINVNYETTWKVRPTDSTESVTLYDLYSREWSITKEGDSNIETSVATSLEKIFTTVGNRTISVRLLDTNVTPNVWKSCSVPVDVTVVQSGGGTHEN